MKYIYNFKDLDNSKVAEVGGKNASFPDAIAKGIENTLEDKKKDR